MHGFIAHVEQMCNACDLEIVIEGVSHWRLLSSDLKRSPADARAHTHYKIILR
jgi:hypothetical protein